jgi:FdhD protein
MKQVKGIRFEQGNATPVNDKLVEEAMLNIYINGAPYTVTMRTPGHDHDLVRGILLTEDVYRETAWPTLHVLETDNEQTIQTINAIIPPHLLGPGFLTQRNLMSVSSCGLCGKTDMQLELEGPLLKNRTELLPETISSFFERMAALQVEFHETGGSHAAAAFSKEGTCLALREDIGRHNAVDKVIGALYREGTQSEAVCLLVSGRVSYEIVSKCYRAGIACLAAVSAPSTLAVKHCTQKGIQLYGFCRNGRLTIYTPTTHR